MRETSLAPVLGRHAPYVGQSVKYSVDGLEPKLSVSLYVELDVFSV